MTEVGSTFASLYDIISKFISPSKKRKLHSEDILPTLPKASSPELSSPSVLRFDIRGAEDRENKRQIVSNSNFGNFSKHQYHIPVVSSPKRTPTPGNKLYDRNLARRSNTGGNSFVLNTDNSPVNSCLTSKFNKAGSPGVAGWKPRTIDSQQNRSLPKYRWTPRRPPISPKVDLCIGSAEAKQSSGGRRISFPSPSRANQVTRGQKADQIQADIQAITSQAMSKLTPRQDRSSDRQTPSSIPIFNVTPLKASNETMVKGEDISDITESLKQFTKAREQSDARTASMQEDNSSRSPGRDSLQWWTPPKEAVQEEESCRASMLTSSSLDMDKLFQEKLAKANSYASGAQAAKVEALARRAKGDQFQQTRDRIRCLEIEKSEQELAALKDLGLLLKQTQLRQEEEEVEEEDKVDQALAPLSEEQEEIVARALARKGDPGAVLASSAFTNIDISKKDLHCLFGLNWLNDEVINFYMGLLQERELRLNPGKPKCHFFNTFFYNKLSKDAGQYNYNNVRRWTDKKLKKYKSILDCDKVIVPIHQGLHWVLAVVNIAEQSLEYYDSLGGQDRECLKDLARYLKDEYQNKRSESVDCTGWQLHFPGSIPHQHNTSDCGVFMLTFADFTSRDAPFNFSQDDMPFIRRRITSEILKGKIDHE